MEDKYKWIVCTTALSNDALAEIGRITATFALLELCLHKLIYYLMGSHEETSLIVTSELSFNNLQTLAMSLAIEHNEKKRITNDILEKLKDTMKSTSTAEQLRNTISHSTYGSSCNDKVIRTKYTAKRKKGLSFQREEMHINDIHDISKVISCASFDIKDTTLEIIDQLKTNNWVCPDAETSQFNVI